MRGLVAHHFVYILNTPDFVSQGDSRRLRRSRWLFRDYDDSELGKADTLLMPPSTTMTCPVR